MDNTMSAKKGDTKVLRHATVMAWLACAAAALTICRPYYFEIIDLQLAFAVRAGSPSRVERQLALGAEPNGHRAGPSTPILSPTPICEAAQRGYVQIVRILLAHGARPNEHAVNDAPALVHAARIGNVDLIRLLLDRGADINGADGDLNTALIAGAPNTDVLRELVSRGTPTDAANTRGQTALLRAAASLNPEGVRLLLDHGAPVNARTARGMTALHWAVMRSPVTSGTPPLRPPLMLVNAPVNAPAAPETAEQRNARKVKCLTITRLLLSNGADPNARNSTGTSPLMEAVVHSPEFASALLARGADPNVRDNSRLTVLSLAERSGSPKLIRLLKSYGGKQ